MKFIINHWIEILSLVISLSALYIAWKSWIKSRAIYNLEFCEFLPDELRDVGNIKIREKLISGDYTILHAEYRSAQYNVLLGKLKK
jgi:hypothetical protein